MENRTLSSSHVDSSHVTQIKNGVWPGTGFEWQMVSTFSVRKFRLGILDYLSRRSVYFGKFPFGQTKTVLPFTSQPKFPEFFGKWGAYHLARKSGNFGLKSNGKVIFRKFHSEIVEYLQRYSSFSVRNGTAEISLPFAKLSSFQSLISRKQ